MLKSLSIAATAAMLMAAASTARAEAMVADPVAGELKSLACHACHGSDGISINDLWPNLAAQKEGYLRKQITAFRDGARVEPVMVPFVQNLSDQDIADIAAYYAALSGKPAEPPARH